MSEKIEAALTAEEWDELEQINMVSFPNGVVLSPARYAHSNMPRHAEAAIALYGQPFGFTPEDVDLLRKEETRARNAAATLLSEGALRIADRYAYLADRIAALLPEKK